MQPAIQFARRWLRALRERIEPTSPLPVFHHPAYRLPLQHEMEQLGLEPRRADLALWALHEVARPRRLDEHEPRKAAWSDLARVHSAEHLEAITRPSSLSAMFGLDDADFPVDTVLNAIRLATGGTIAAARVALERGGPALNLLGGFHHAGPASGGGFCVINDIAIAIAAVRADGCEGTIVVLDLDAHPPDGTAACLVDEDVWIGSLSGSDWGEISDVDETVLPEHSSDETYLDALEALLSRAPEPVLTFVLAGGDVLADDRHGALAMSLRGARRRDRMVHGWLDDSPSVWLPAGGYHPDSWRVLAGTGAILAGASSWRLTRLDDPMVHHYSRVSRTLTAEQLTGVHDESWFSPDEIDTMFGSSRKSTRFLDYYTAQGLEQGLHAYGILEHIKRLGYRELHIEIDRSDTGDRFQLRGKAKGSEHLLVSSILRRESVGEHDLLYVEWLNLRHPLAAFAEGRPPLPGQDVPGLGMAWEANALFVRVADRLGLDGMAWRPAWFHVAWIARHSCTFLDPAVQGRFEALSRDLGHLGVGALTRAVSEGRVRADGEPWSWPAEPMVSFVAHPPTRDDEGVRHRPRLDDAWEQATAEARDAAIFTV